MKAFPRNGAWAIDEKGKVGVLFLAGDREEFHQVDDVGFTQKVQIRPWAGLQIAPLANIPAARIEGASAESLAKRGYV